MRTLKFRAWNKETKTMVDLHKITPFALGIDPTIAGGRMGVYIPDHSGIEVMQFTGLRDRNGKEIYTDDIIEGNLYDRRIPIMGKIVYDAEHGFYALQNLAGNTPLYKIADINLLGNDHEHPELLEVKA